MNVTSRAWVRRRQNVAVFVSAARICDSHVAIVQQTPKGCCNPTLYRI